MKTLKVGGYAVDTKGRIPWNYPIIKSGDVTIGRTLILRKLVVAEGGKKVIDPERLGDIISRYRDEIERDDVMFSEIFSGVFSQDYYL